MTSPSPSSTAPSARTGLGLAAMIAFVAVCLVPAPATAGGGDDGPVWLPTPYPLMGAHVAAYRPTSCKCFDRYIWGAEAGLGLSWNRFLNLEASVRSGAMVFQGTGAFPFTGFSAGLRSAVAPATSHWWDDFYVRSGLTRISFRQTRDPGMTGLYARPGWSVKLIAGLRLEQEVVLDYYFGTMRHFELGTQTSFRYRF